MWNLRSTFPLDEAALARRALGQILADPITWAPLAPAVAACTLGSGAQSGRTARKYRHGAGSSPDCRAWAAILASRYVLPRKV